MQNKYKVFEEQLWKIEDIKQQYALLKDYMLSLSFNELMEWHKQSSERLHSIHKKLMVEGLSDEQKKDYLPIFSKFDDLQAQLQMPSVC